MSYQIYYDKAFIKVNDKFVPMVNSGSNNCWEVNYCNREIPEKNWSVLNYTMRSKVLFTADEIVEIAKRYEQLSQDNGMCFKTRNKCFEAGEFERWILNGMKSALTVEEYVGCGNELYILDYSCGKTEDWKYYDVTTTEEFLEVLDKLKGSKCISVGFENNREVKRPRRESKNEKIHKRGKFYVLKIDSENGSYFCSFRKNNTTFCQKPDYDFVRAFPTEKAALKYLEKYKVRLGKFKLKPVLIENAA